MEYTYYINDGIVYRSFYLGDNKITEFVGLEKQMEVDETETEITLFWVIFNLDVEKYEIDQANESQFDYNGEKYTPTNGIYVIVKQ